MFGGHRWIKATVLNVMILVLIFAFTDMTYETNDDYAISVRMLQGDPFTYYINYCVCRFIIFLQGIFTSVNAFVAFQVFLSLVAFICITGIMLGKGRGFLFNLMTIMIIAVYSFDHYSVIQFTKTSILLLTAGMMMIIDAMVEKKGLPWYVVGLLLFYLGSSLRIQNTFVALGFGGLFLIFWVLDNRKELIPGGYLTGSRIVMYVVLLLLIAGSLGLHQWSQGMNSSTPELRTYHEFDDERYVAVDFGEYDNYDESKSDFDRLGISKNDLYLIDNWYFDYDGAASTDNLKKINEIYSKSRESSSEKAVSAVRSTVKTIISKVKDLSSIGIHIIILMLIALSGLILLRPRYWLYIIALGVSSVGIYIALFYMGRPAYRAMYGVDLSATVWLIYYYTPSRYRSSAGGEGGPLRVVNSVFSIVMILMLAYGIVAFADRSESKHNDIAGSIRSEALTEYIDGKEDKVFVFATRDKRNTTPYAEPMMAPDPDENVFNFGGWGTLSPYMMDRLESYGLQNVFGDIIDNKDVYVIEKRNVDRMEEYLNKWYPQYGGGIHYVKVDEVDGTNIWQIVGDSSKT